MKKFLLALGLLILAPSFAQELAPTLLWKITGPDKNMPPSYIYGTVHVGCNIDLNSQVQRALQETQQLYLEIKMDDAQLQAKMMKGAMMKDGTTISKLLSADDAKILSDFLQKEVGFSLQMVDALKPMLLSSMLLPKMLPCSMQSVEEILMKITKEQSEQVYGLETVQDQLDVFDAIPYDVQANELLKMAKDNMKESKEQMQQMLSIYQSQDIQNLYDFSLNAGDKMMATYQDVLLNNRNQNWIPIITKISGEVPTFFAVGAAHLAGKNGVLTLLKKEGFTVEAVMPE
jgi:uncharacterized protein YbaP (TraB family)